MTYILDMVYLNKNKIIKVRHFDFISMGKECDFWDILKNIEGLDSDKRIDKIQIINPRPTPNIVWQIKKIRINDNEHYWEEIR